MENKLPKITIDDIEYNSEDLSDNGKAQLASLQFLEVQMKKIKAEIAPDKLKITGTNFIW